MLNTYNKILQIQRLNKSRINNLKNRMLFLHYYWETMKVDMSRVFNSEKEDSRIEASRAVGVKILSIRQPVREKFMKMYVDYCRYIYIYQFITWRVVKLKILGLSLQDE
jgi:hypothetical protein